MDMSGRRHQTKEQRADMRRMSGVRGGTARYWGCARKSRYGSRERAHQAALGKKRKFGLDCDLYAYKCPWCHGWHLTKAPQEGSAPVALADGHERLGAA